MQLLWFKLWQTKNHIVIASKQLHRVKLKESWHPESCFAVVYVFIHDKQLSDSVYTNDEYS